MLECLIFVLIREKDQEEEQYDDDATGGKTMVQRCTEHITLS